MTLTWHEVKKDGAPTPDKPVLLWRPPMQNNAYDAGVWRRDGYWHSKGELRALALNYFTHWAYIEPPPL